MKTEVTDLPEEIQDMLSEFSDIMVDDLPNELPPRDISHQNDFIPGASLPNKALYRLTPQENEEVRKQVQGFGQRIGPEESESMCSTSSTDTKEGW